MIIGLIPARSGSKGVEDKNIRDLCGKPLLAYSIAIGKQVKSIDRVIVSTDSAYYADISQSFGAEVPFLRPKEISGDLSSDYEFVKHTLDWLYETEQYQPELIVHLRPTSPLREQQVVQAAIDHIKKNPSATALRSVNEMSESAYKTFEIEDGFLKCLVSGSFDLDAANRPRQEFATTYQPNGYVDIIRSSCVLANNVIHGNCVLAFHTPRAGEIDTLDDFDYLEYQLSKAPDYVNNLFK
jgi:N-acylneuraminate cytidylyltransferase